MSYILEALKKSELERSGEQPPEWTHKDTTAEVAESPRSSRLPIIILIVLLPVLFGLVYWIFFRVSDNKLDMTDPDPMALAQIETDVEPAATTAPSMTSAVPNTKKNKKITLQDFNAAQGIESKPVLEKKPAAVKSQPSVVFSDQPLDTESNNTKPPTRASVASSAVIDDAPTVSIFELPESLRSSLPTLLFAGHVYSSDPKKRHIMINGKKLREGDSAATGVVLEKITVSGAEFTYKNRHFSLSALQDWENK